MKKLLNSVMALLLVVATASTFTACTEEEEYPPQEEKQIKEATITATFCVNKAFADTYDVRAISSTGQEINLSTTTSDVIFAGSKMPMYTLTLQATSPTLPVSAAMDITFTLKDGYQVPEKSDFALSAFATGVVKYTDGTDGTLSTKDFELENSGVLGSKIVEYTAYINKHFGHLKAIFQEDGIMVDVSSDE